MGKTVITKSRAQSVLYEYADSFFDRKRKVLIPCNTCESVPLTYLKLGIPFEMVDADLASMSISLDLAEDKLNRRIEEYQGLHYVCNYGIVSSDSLNRLRAIKDTYGISVILDKCLCIPPVDMDNEELYADIEVYSTGGRKCVDLGGGGFGLFESTIASQWKNQRFPMSEEDYRRMKSIFQTTPQRWKECSQLQWLVDEPLENSDEYFRELREKREDVIRHKRKLNEIYSQIIPVELQIGESVNDWRFELRLANRDEVLRMIFQNELFASNHYRPWGNGVFTDECFPVAERIQREILNLFNDFYFTENQAIRTAELIRENGKPCIDALLR